MKIAIIGSGGREHALVHHLSNSKKITKIYSIPVSYTHLTLPTSDLV